MNARDERIEALVKLTDDVWYGRVTIEAAHERVGEILAAPKEAGGGGSLLHGEWPAAFRDGSIVGVPGEAKQWGSYDEWRASHEFTKLQADVVRLTAENAANKERLQLALLALESAQDGCRVLTAKLAAPSKEAGAELTGDHSWRVGPFQIGASDEGGYWSIVISRGQQIVAMAGNPPGDQRQEGPPPGFRYPMDDGEGHVIETTDANGYVPTSPPTEAAAAVGAIDLSSISKQATPERYAYAEGFNDGLAALSPTASAAREGS